VAPGFCGSYRGNVVDYKGLAELLGMIGSEVSPVPPLSERRPASIGTLGAFLTSLRYFDFRKRPRAVALFAFLRLNTHREHEALKCASSPKMQVIFVQSLHDPR
jgi:hypothetical protein